MSSAPLREASETGNRRCNVFRDPCDRGKYEASLLEYALIRRNTHTGRALGETTSLGKLEAILGRPLLPAQTRPALKGQTIGMVSPDF